MFSLIRLKTQIEVALVAAAILGSVVFMVHRGYQNALQESYDRGRSDLLIEIGERSAKLAEALRGADGGHGDATEDYDWIDRELERIGVRVIPEAGAPATR